MRSFFNRLLLFSETHILMSKYTLRCLFLKLMAKFNWGAKGRNIVKLLKIDFLLTDSNGLALSNFARKIPWICLDGGCKTLESEITLEFEAEVCGWWHYDFFSNPWRVHHLWIKSIFTRIFTHCSHNFNPFHPFLRFTIFK